MIRLYEESVEVATYGPYIMVGSVRIKNGCCKNKPVMITVNPLRAGRLNYSCQCACGGWCTSGHSTASKALEEYEEMSNRAIVDKAMDWAAEEQRA